MLPQSTFYQVLLGWYNQNAHQFYDPSQVSRSLVGFAFPLFGQQMFDALGYGGGNSLLAGLAIVLGIPFPIWLWYYGEQMRMKSSLTR